MHLTNNCMHAPDTVRGVRGGVQGVALLQGALEWHCSTRSGLVWGSPYGWPLEARRAFESAAFQVSDISAVY